MPFSIRPSRRFPLLPLMALASLLMLDTPSHAGLCFPPTIEKESAYHYLLSLADSFGYAKEAIDRHAEPESTSFEDNNFKFLYATKLSKSDYECAASQVAPYSTSSDETIKLSALGVGMVFLRLADLQEQGVLEFKAVLDAGPKEFKQGTFSERQAERATLINDTWKLLIPAAIAATYTVIEKDPETGLMSRLSLTTKQRTEVLEKLRSAFGVEVTRGMKAGQISLVAAAAAIYEVIGNQPRKTRDNR